MPSKKPTILCRTTEKTKEKLEKIAEKEKRSLSNLTEKILEEYIDNYEKENGNIIIIGHDNNGTINL